ncbi:hypothetical protein D5086_028326 [Populus alba]|uniref:Uncharacterized protein n=1 Tax=Populus alba TaxID=43335 RepID=A0ACC4AXU5_POPAL
MEARGGYGGWWLAFGKTMRCSNCGKHLIEFSYDLCLVMLACGGNELECPTDRSFHIATATTPIVRAYLFRLSNNVAQYKFSNSILVNLKILVYGDAPTFCKKMDIRQYCILGYGAVLGGGRIDRAPVNPDASCSRGWILSKVD